MGTGKYSTVTAALPGTNEVKDFMLMFLLQEGWLAKHAVSDEDRLAAEQARNKSDNRPDDPMQGLEGLDVAGPQPV